MTTFPVHYLVEMPPRYDRVQLGARLLAVIVLGLVGLSLGLLYVVAYLALPGFAAIRLAGGRDPEAYLRDDGPRLVRGLRWFAAIYAWFGLVTDHLPARSPDETVHVEIEPSGRPTSGQALWRLVTGIPSAFFLAVLGWVAMFVWLWAALLVLVRRRVGSGTFRYLAGVQRWSIRLLAYQASLIEEYPPFSLAELPHPLND